MKNCLFYLLLVSSVIPSHGQSHPPLLPVGYGAYGQNPDAFSFTRNQACLGRMETTMVGIYGERLFMLEELSQYLVALALPSDVGGFGLRAGLFGDRAYRETLLGLAYGRKFGSSMDIGVQFNHHSISIPGYGKASSIGFEAGLLLHLTGKLVAGLHVSNPSGAKFGIEQREKFPSSYSFAMGFDASDKLFISGIIMKSEGSPVDVVAAIRYQLHQRVRLSTGCATAVSRPWLAIGYTFSHFRLETIMSMQPVLGMTPGLAIHYDFISRKIKTD